MRSVVLLTGGLCRRRHSLTCCALLAFVISQARRSVSDADMAKYSAFAATMQQQRASLGGGMGASNFRFPRAGGGGGGSAGAAGADEEDLYS